MIAETAKIDCDIKIVNAEIFDGVSALPKFGGVAVREGLIIGLGDVSSFRGTQEFDAQGLTLCPGFIDVHTHDDLAVIETPDLFCKVSQGVTSVVVGNCGVSLAPLSTPARLPNAPFSFLGPEEIYRYPTFTDYLQSVAKARPHVNVFALVGHTTLRAGVMDDFDRAANSSEVESMCRMLDASLSEGAIGLSTGLAYPPALLAPTEEIISLAKIVGAHGAIYATHIRDEADAVIEAVKEAIEIADSSSSRLVLSHHKCIGKANWGKSKATLAIVDEYANRAEIALDVYPYTASSTALLPHKIQFAEKVIVTESENHSEVSGWDLRDICSHWNCSVAVCLEKLGAAKAVYHNMCDDDLNRILRHSLSMVASDGMPSDKIPHPRLWGTFPRLFGRYVRQQQVLSFADALKKVTSKPAKVFGLKGRGELQLGHHADINIVNRSEITDVATFETPETPSIGVQLVVKGGEVVLDNLTSSRA
jgi:N-acyl-D-amino-acid deacylase